MGRLEDKIISEKINSLVSLPESYQPSVESKWELLAAGLQVKKPEKRRYYLIAFAACFFLLCGLGWLILNKNIPKEIEVREAELLLKNKLSTSGNETAEFEYYKATENQYNNYPGTGTNLNVLPETKKSPSILRKNVENNSFLNASVQGIADQVRDYEKEKTQSIQTFANKIADSLSYSNKNILVAVKSKPKRKARFIEIDFEDESGNNSAPPEADYAQNKFRFRFGISATNSASANNGNTSFFKIQMNFPLKDN